MAKKLSANAGCQVAHNQNVMAAGPWAPQLLQDVSKPRLQISWSAFPTNPAA